MIITPIIAMDRAAVSATVALDRASVRTIDKDGRLHVALSNISKATVNPYLGREIPHALELGLDPDRVYFMLRCPVELAAGSLTFNNLPILSRHIPVTAEAPAQDLVIGSTGTDAGFVAPYLQNSAVIWVKSEIDHIETERKKEWSCAYHYRADMTPGVFMGLRYDGVMRDIIGNHVALVDQGRAGRDVIVGDNMPGAVKMAVLKSRRAIMLSGAVAALVAPMLAQDARLDLSDVLKDYTAANHGDRATLAGSIVSHVKPLLAQDAAMDTAAVTQLIAAVEGVQMTLAEDAINEAITPAPTPAVVTPPPAMDTASQVRALCADKLGAADLVALDAILGGTTPAVVTPPPAMDAAAIAATVGRTVADLREAERAVEPIIGRITVAQDSAAATYRLALDHAKIDHAGIEDVKALRALVGTIKTDGVTPPIALDHQSVQNDFRSRFPGAGQLVN